MDCPSTTNAIDVRGFEKRGGEIVELALQLGLELDDNAAVMGSPLDRRNPDDPLLLRELMARAESLAREHAIHSVLVGLSGFEGDVVFPEIVDFVESALRVDDSVFRMTRERVVLLLTDVDRTRAAGIVERLLAEYRANFPSTTDPAVGLGFFEVVPGENDLSVKHVLPILFASPPKSH